MNVQRIVLASTLVIGGVVAIVTACTTLTDIAPNQCGNLIVEPEAGEQCDFWAYQDAFACFRSDAGTKACHVACNDAGACPSGWGCGTDGVCRSPNETYLGTPIVTTDVREMSLSDFDGDGQLDLVARGLASTAIYFFDSKGVSNGVAGPLATTRGRLTTGVLAPNSHPSLILFDTLVTQGGLVAGTGFDVWNGLANRTLSPILFSSTPINATESRVIPAQVLGNGPHPGNDDIMVLAQGQFGIGLGYFNAGTPLGIDYFLPEPPSSTIRGDVPVARIPANAPCDSLVIGYRNVAGAHVLRTCDDAGNAFDATQEASTVPFTSQIDSPVFLVDTNKDAIPDLVTFNSQGEMQVALGQANGSFSPGGAPTNVGLLTPPLAMGDLDGDGAFDFVEPDTGIFLSSTKQHVLPSFTLTYARIADMNGDGFPDVVGISNVGVDFWSGTGGALLNHRLYDISNTNAITIGDYDGDKNLDFLVSSGTLSPNLWIMWGAFAGYPSAPTLLGSGVAVDHMSSGKLTWFFGDPPDAVWSAVVVTREDGGTLAIAPLQGHSSRQLTSPFILSDPDASNGSPFTNPHLPIVGALGTPNAIDASTTLSMLAAPVFDDAGTVLLEPWTVPAANDTRVFEAPNTKAPTDGGLSFLATSGSSAQGVAMTMLDLDPSTHDGDEMIVVVPSSVAANGTDPAKDGTFAIAKFDGKTWTASSIDSTFAGMTRMFGDIVLPTRLRRADFDGDGIEDVFLVYADAYTGPSTNPTSTISAEVRFGDGKGGFSATAKLTDVTSAAPIYALGTPGRQIVSVNAKGITIYKIVPCADQSMHCFDTGTLVRGANLAQTIEVVAGDVTGDGIDDLIVANHIGFQVWVGGATLP